MEIRNEKEERLRAHLQSEIVNLSFRKMKTDEIRHMRCTLKDEYVPRVDDTKPSRKEPPGLMTVYDMDVKEWRRFYVDRLESVEGWEPEWEPINDVSNSVDVFA